MQVKCTYSSNDSVFTIGRFYELAYREAMENTYFDESIPMWRKLRGEIAFAMRHGFYTDHNTLTDAELVTILYEGE